MSMETKTLHIIRGLPGSGKTTLARKLCGDRFCEADLDFGEGKGYVFEKEKLGDAHAWCRRRIEAMMNDGTVASVAVSNTFVQRWEFAPYIDIAERLGWKCEIIVCEGNYGNVHGVPQDVVERMRTRWEK